MAAPLGMEFESSKEPPVKKRRFFKDPDEPCSDPPFHSPHEDSPTIPKKRFFKDEDEIKAEAEERSVLAERSENGLPERAAAAQPPPELKHEPSSTVAFDQDTFESFIGDKVTPDVLAIIRDHCGDDLERAVNMYFDGTYKKLKMSPFLAAILVNSERTTP